MIQRFAFTGMPGSGKSTTGACLAKRLNIPFFDLDELIVGKIGIPIPEYFKTNGEMAFREMEHQVLVHFLQSTRGPWVLACGGGTPCFFDNMERLNAVCKTIFLDTDLEIILHRLRQKGNHTIFGSNESEEERVHLTRIMSLRAPFYRQSRLIIGQKELDNPYLFTKRLYLFTKA